LAAHVSLHFLLRGLDMGLKRLYPVYRSVHRVFDPEVVAGQMRSGPNYLGSFPIDHVAQDDPWTNRQAPLEEAGQSRKRFGSELYC